MILPILAYGDSVLRKTAKVIEPGEKGLEELIVNMFETMYNAHGVGLAAPQVGKSLRLFIVDASIYAKDDDDETVSKEERSKLKNFKRTFINAKMIEENGEKWPFNEGCLSIPKIREDVLRPPQIRISYVDDKFQRHEESFTGLAARIIQHEYDHIEGKLFTDRINPLRRRLLKGKLDDISKGKVDVDYKMKFPKSR